MSTFRKSQQWISKLQYFPGKYNIYFLKNENLFISLAFIALCCNNFITIDMILKTFLTSKCYVLSEYVNNKTQIWLKVAKNWFLEGQCLKFCSNHGFMNSFHIFEHVLSIRKGIKIKKKPKLPQKSSIFFDKMTKFWQIFTILFEESI